MSTLMSTMSNAFKPVANGCCRLAIGKKGKFEIAIKTASGDYKSYNLETGELVNRDNFVFDIGQDVFFSVPTDKLAPGDIILVNNTPRCVVEVVKDNRVKVVNYNDSTEDTLLVERHILFGHKYLYSKIVSIMSLMGGKSGTGMESMFKWMLMSRMFGGSSNPFGNMFGGTSSASNPIGGMMQFMMMKQMFGGDDSGELGFMGNLFDGLNLDGLFSSEEEPEEDKESK